MESHQGGSSALASYDLLKFLIQLTDEEQIELMVALIKMGYDV